MWGILSRKYFFKAYLWGNFLWILPYKWYPKTRRLELSVSWLRYNLWLYLNTYGGIVGVLWCLLRSVQMYFRRKESNLYLAYYIVCTVVTLCLLCPVIFNLNLFRCRFETAQWHEQYCVFCKDFKARYGLAKENNKTFRQQAANDPVGIYCMVLYYLSLVVQGFFYFIPLVHPQLPVLPISLAIELEVPLWFLVPFGIFQYVIVVRYIMIWFALMYLNCFPGLEYIFTLIELCREINVKLQRHNTSDKLRTSRELMRVLREVQVLHALAMYIYTPIVLPSAEWLFLVWAVYCIYGCIRVSGYFGLALFSAAILILLFLSVTFKRLAGVPLAFDEALRNWKERSRFRIVKKFTRSMKPFKVYCGDFYFCDKGMVLNMLRFIVESVADLLVLR